MFRSAVCSALLCHIVLSLAIASSVDDSSVSGKSVLNVVDAAFRQEAYLNEQISNSLRASAFSPASNHGMLPDMPMPSDSSDPLLPSARDTELDSPPGASSEVPAAIPSESSEQFGPASSEALPGMSAMSIKAMRSPSSPAQIASGSHARLGQSVNLAAVRQHTSTVVDADIRSWRPGAGSGVADIVSFGAFAKGLYQVDLKHNKFTMDSVLALKWKDPRVVSLVPVGMTEVSMSGRQALAKIWMPEVVITNRDIRKMEVISTTVTIWATGEVSKVERAIVVCNNVYELEQYPFDKQQLALKIASSKYMLDDVILQPDSDKSSSGSSPGVMAATPYAMDSYRVFAFDETDGALKKSRGVLELTIARKFGGYYENHLKPSFMLLMISWGVFWFPFENPFITPRLALSILALLAFSNLLKASDAVLPNGSPFNWNDLFNLQVQAMMFLTIILNIFSESCKHKLKMEALGEGVNNEAKVVLPGLSIVLITIVLTAGAYKWLSISLAGVVTQVLAGVVVVIYIAHNAARVNSHQEQRRQLEEQAKQIAERIELEKQLETGSSGKPPEGAVRA